jgi:hypothetical protein
VRGGNAHIQSMGRHTYLKGMGEWLLSGECVVATDAFSILLFMIDSFTQLGAAVRKRRFSPLYVRTRNPMKLDFSISTFLIAKVVLY